MENNEDFNLDVDEEEENKKNIFQQVTENPQILENVRTVTILLVAFVLPLLYWGYASSFDIRSLFNLNIGALAGITLFNSFMLWIEIGSKAEKHAYTLTPKLNKLSKENNDKKEYVSKYIDEAIEFIDEHNEKEQEKTNKLYKERKIKKLKHKINRATIKGKSRKRERLEAKLNVVEKTEFVKYRNWRGKRYYKPIKIKKLISFESTDSIVITGDDSVSYNPKKDGAVRWFAFSLLKHMGIGISGSLPFLIQESTKNILIFYGLMTLTLITTAISRYIKIRFKSLNKMIRVNMNVKLLLDKMIKYIDENKDSGGGV